jgi:hypothetical protein
MTEAIRAILQPLWPALAAAAALGVLFGWLGWREQAAGFFGRLGLILAVIALAGGVALALLGRVPGPPGLWLEIALATALAYLSGCILGSIVRGIWTWIASRSERVAPAA